MLQFTLRIVKLNKSAENDIVAPFNELRELRVVSCSYVHILFLSCTGGLAIAISNLNTTDAPNGTETELGGATRKKQSHINYFCINFKERIKLSNVHIINMIHY